MDAAATTAALLYVNERLATAGREGFEVTFFCECGACLAESVSLTLDEYDEIRAREDLVFAAGHEGARPRRGSPVPPISAIPLGRIDTWARGPLDTIDWRTDLWRGRSRQAELIAS